MKSTACAALFLPSFVLLAAVATSCEEGTPPLGEFRDDCQIDADCKSGVCLNDADGLGNEETCSLDCETDGCPNGFACAEGRDGLRACVAPCTHGDHDNYACVDDVPVPCEMDDGRGCGSCGCDDAELHCHLDMACEPLHGLGEPCDDVERCESDHCGFPAAGGPLVCLVPIWEACDESNCAHCFEAGTETHCTRECSSEWPCGDGFVCAYRSSTDLFLCVPRCTADDECPPEWSCGAYVGVSGHLGGSGCLEP